MATSSSKYDTSPEAEAIQLACFRKMSTQERIARTCSWSFRLKQMAFAAVRRRFPQLSDHETQLKLIELTYGVLAVTACCAGRKEWELSATDGLVESLGPVVAVLNKLEIPHYVGGSIASSFHGAIRSTLDVDLVCEMQESQVASFLNGIDDRFYVSESAVRQAIKNGSCFKLIHLPSSFKVDVFVSRQRSFDRACMRRATKVTLGDVTSVTVPILTVEDSIVSKLEWFRLTHETSERQWDDVTKLMRLQGFAADRQYLQQAAASVGVTDLLERLFAESSDGLKG